MQQRLVDEEVVDQHHDQGNKEIEKDEISKFTPACPAFEIQIVLKNDVEIIAFESLHRFTSSP